LQFVKGGFSFRLNKSLKVKKDQRVRGSLEYQKFKNYVWQSPSGPNAGKLSLQLRTSFIQVQLGSNTSAAKADRSSTFTAGLEGLLHPVVGTSDGESKKA
jgi:hypothetical protein